MELSHITDPLLATSGLLIAFGFSKLLDQLVLGDWQVISAGEFDLAARGIWLLARFRWCYRSRVRFKRCVRGRHQAHR